MKMKLITPVNSDYKTVFAKFDLELFKSLMPPGLKVTVLRFDGSREGDEVHIDVQAGPVTQHWESRIVHHHENESECQFIDEGKKLPWPFVSWRHVHTIRKTGDGTCEIVDELTYTTENPGLDVVAWPALYAQFLFRKPVYKKL